MPCGKGWKWHCRETKFRNFLEGHPSLKCLQRSNFPPRAYTFKISCYAPDRVRVSCLTVPANISNLFIKVNEKHNHETRFSSSCNFYINRSRLNQNHGFLLSSELFCDQLRHLPKRAFKKHINDMLFLLLEAEDDYVELPILLQKIANYQAKTEFNL